MHRHVHRLRERSPEAASPAWVQLVLSDWHTDPDDASSCATEPDGNFELEHSGGAID